jgi:cytoskeleton protein RodZ
MASSEPTGVGTVLRSARQARGLSLEEASRDTKLRADQLRALEDERFDQLMGEVYVRGSLRSYAHYLGLDADDVVERYGGASVEPPSPVPPARIGRIERAITASRIRDSQRLAIMLALTLLVGAVAFGLLSQRRSAPAAAGPPTGIVAISPAPTGAGVQATLIAEGVVRVVVVLDGEKSSFVMQRGEERALAASSKLQLRAARGGVLEVSVNGVDLGVPGSKGRSWARTFTPLKPSPQPSSSPSGVGGSSSPAG